MGTVKSSEKSEIFRFPRLEKATVRHVEVVGRRCGGDYKKLDRTVKKKSSMRNNKFGRKMVKINF